MGKFGQRGGSGKHIIPVEGQLPNPIKKNSWYRIYNSIDEVNFPNGLYETDQNRYPTFRPIQSNGAGGGDSIDWANLPTYKDNAAALSGGLVVGDWYLLTADNPYAIASPSDSRAARIVQ